MALQLYYWVLSIWSLLFIFNLITFKWSFFSAVYPFRTNFISYSFISSFKFLHLKICELFSKSPQSQYSIIPLFAPRSFFRHLWKIVLADLRGTCLPGVVGNQPFKDLYNKCWPPCCPLLVFVLDIGILLHRPFVSKNF